MPTLEEKLEALPILDPLTREPEESPLDNGGKWGEAKDTISRGRATATGWTAINDKELVGARWLDPIDTRSESALAIGFGALPALQQFIAFGWDAGGSVAIGREGYGWLGFIFLSGEFLGEFRIEEELESGEIFYLVTDAFGCRLYRKKPGGEIALIVDKSGVAGEGDEAGKEDDEAQITFFPEEVSGTEIRLINFSMAVIGEAPVNSALPVISGTLAKGETLTSTHGEWEGSVGEYRYMWQISTGTGWLNLLSYYHLSPSGDPEHPDGKELVVPSYAVGRKLRCVVRALGGTGPVFATSDPVEIPGTATPGEVFAGAKIDSYNFIEEATEGRIAEVPDPLGSGETVLKFTVENADVYPLTSTENPRAKLAAPPLFIEGSEIWLRNRFLLPSDFPDIPAGGWMLLLDYWGLPFLDSAPWKVGVDQFTEGGTSYNDLRFQRNETYGYDVPWSVPVIKGQWVDIVLHLDFSEAGYVEMWVNGKRVTFFDPAQALVYNPSAVAPTTKLEMATRDFSITEGPVGPSISQYRKVGMFEEATVYFKPLEMWLDLGAPALEAVTSSATSITASSATINGIVNVASLPAIYWFEYGETKAYGSETTKEKGLEEAAAVSAAITGLKPKTTYHFRLVAEDSEGESFGEDVSFTTEAPIRVAVTREFPPDQLAVRVADPAAGQTVARWAEDEHQAENVLSGITKSGEMSGGHKEMGGILARDPRVDYPDLALYNDLYLEQPGGENVWEGRSQKAPESDGDHMAIEPKAVGHQAALEDRNGLRIGFIDCDLSKWGDPSTQRRVNLTAGNFQLDGNVSNGWQGDGDQGPGILISLEGLTSKPEWTDAGESWFDGGRVPIGAALYHFLEIKGGSGSQFTTQLKFGSDDLLSVNHEGPNHEGNTNSSTFEYVEAVLENMLFAVLEGRRLAKGGEETPLIDQFLWEYPKIISRAALGLALQGTWPNVGFTAKQMLEVAVPQNSYLEARDEDLEDDGFVIPQAWFSDPGNLANVIKELTKYGLYYWFVLNGKRLELRAPGTFGREWQAYVGPSELKETGEDGERVWDRIVVSYQDTSGRTLTVGYPGSGADEEFAGLEVTDPDNAAVKSGRPREDLLTLNGISNGEIAKQAGERFLEEASQISHAGEATLRGYIQDSAGIFRPVAQVQPGDRIRFPDAGSSGTGSRQIVQASYDHDSRTTTVSLDAPPEALQALLERLGASISSLNL